MRFPKICLGLIFLSLLVENKISAQSVISWSNTAASTAWLTNGNWTGNVYPSTGNIAQFNNAGTASTSGINMNTLAGNLSIAGLEVTNLRTTNNLAIGNSSAVSGTLTITGGNINSNPNTILRNASSKNFTVQDQVGGTGLMGLALGNTTDNKIFLDGSGNITISDIISGAANYPLSIQGAGTGVVKITGIANVFSGTISYLGVETEMSADGSFGAVPSSINPGAIIIDGGRMTAVATYTLNANRGIKVGSSAGTSISVKTGASVLTYNGVISDLSTNGSWSKQGGNMLQLGGSSVYTGSTSVNNGTLQIIGGNDRLPVTTLLSLGQSANTNLGTFDMNGFNQQIAGLSSVAGTNSTANKNSVISTTGPATLNINSASSYTYGMGTAANSGIISGAVTVIKDGSGLQVLGDINSYTGMTQINSGELRFSPNANETLNSSMILNGGTLGTSGITSGVNLGFSTLELSDNSVISLGSGTHTLSFLSSNSVSWNATKTLTITGWQGVYNSPAGSSGTDGQIYIGNDNSGLTAAQLSQITFFDGAAYYDAMLLANGELVPYLCVAPTINSITSNGPVCEGAVLNFSATVNGTLTTSYSWSGPNTFTSNVQNPVINNVALIDAGVYTVTATDLCGSVSSTISVSVNTLPAVMANSTNSAVCMGQTVTLTGSGATTYTWTSGVNDAVAFSPTATAVYTVTGTDSNGCNNSDSVKVTVNLLPAVMANSTSSAVCIGQTVTLTGSGATTYTWTSGVNDAVAFSPTATAVYTVTGTDSNGCNNSDSVKITVNPLPVVSVSSFTNILCVTDPTLALSGSPLGGTFSGTGVSGSAFDPSVSGAGVFMVYYLVTDVNNCSASDSTSITVSLCTGIAEQPKETDAIRIYPNPVKDYLTVHSPQENNVIDIFDITGKIIVSRRSESKKEMIDLSSFANGLYLMKVSYGDEVQYVRFIKE